MKYVAFVGSSGPQSPEAVAVMNRDLPAYLEEMERRGVRGFGRELNLPDTAATVRVRAREVLVTDGPFTETKEHIAGLDLLECDDLEEAIEVEAKSPVARFLPFEIRPVRQTLRLGAGVSAFAEGDDSAGTPYLLIAWVSPSAGRQADEPLTQECEAWRDGLEARGVLVLGGEVCGPETAKTIRFSDGTMELSDGPFVDIEASIACIDVVRCADRPEAIELAAAHPLAQSDAIEVRAFYSERS